MLVRLGIREYKIFSPHHTILTHAAVQGHQALWEDVKHLELAEELHCHPNLLILRSHPKAKTKLMVHPKSLCVVHLLPLVSHLILSIHCHCLQKGRTSDYLCSDPISFPTNRTTPHWIPTKQSTTIYVYYIITTSLWCFQAQRPGHYRRSPSVRRPPPSAPGRSQRCRRGRVPCGCLPSPEHPPEPWTDGRRSPYGVVDVVENKSLVRLSSTWSWSEI